MIETVVKKLFILAFKALDFPWGNLETPKQNEVRFLVTRVPAICHSVVKHWGQVAQVPLADFPGSPAPGTLVGQEGVVHVLGGTGSCCLREQFQHLPQARRKSTWAPHQSSFCLARLSGNTEVPGSCKFRGKSVISWVRHCLLRAWCRIHVQRKHLGVQR